MRYTDERAENGLKQTLRVTIQNKQINREFRSKGEAVEWLRKNGYDREAIRKCKIG